MQMQVVLNSKTKFLSHSKYKRVYTNSEDENEYKYIPKSEFNVHYKIPSHNDSGTQFLLNF